MKTFVDHGGDAVWYREGYGNWEANAASWIESDLPFRRLVVRYEDLRADTLATMRAIAQFAGLASDDAALSGAIERSSMAKLAAMEEREVREGSPGFFYGNRSVHSFERGARFIGGGTVDGRRLAPTDAECARASERFGPAMKRFGYA